jgi:alpha-beta hydrolase superfamily lysophospholipase
MTVIMPTFTETTLTSSIGQTIYVRQWLPDGETKHAAPLSHGVFEHGGRYEHVAERFLKHGYAVWALDHYGHGKSPGPRGDIQHPDHFVDDMKIVIAALTEATKHEPVLLGHSMGGAIAALYAVRHQDMLRALALSSPALKTHASPLLIAVSRMLAFAAPTMQTPSGLNQPATHNAEWEAWKKGDDLKHDRMTLRLARFIVDAGDEARAKADTLRIPVGMFVAGEDTYVDKRGAQEFFRNLPPGIGEYHEYDGYYHEIFNELGRDMPLNDLETWQVKLDRT